MRRSLAWQHPTFLLISPRASEISRSFRSSYHSWMLEAAFTELNLTSEYMGQNRYRRISTFNECGMVRSAAADGLVFVRVDRPFGIGWPAGASSRNFQPRKLGRKTLDVGRPSFR